MSHLIEEYAKCLGVKIGRPQISDHFYPITSDKYITLQTSKGIQSRNYSHWETVVSMIKKNAKGYDVIQVGSKEDYQCKGVDYDLRGSTSFKNIVYILKGSSLHICVDSFSLHLSSCLDIPSISIFSDMLPEQSGPVWNRESKHFCLSPDLEGSKPSYSNTDKNKSIDKINPEEIFFKALNFIDANNNLDGYKTLNIGQYYNNSILEVVPDHHCPLGFLPRSIVNLRCDYTDDDSFIHEWFNFKINLMTSRKIDLNLIYRNRSNIAGITLFMEDLNFDEDYLCSLDSMNIKYSLVCRERENISELRFNFFDRTIEEYIKKKNKDLDFCSELCDNTFYHSNKLLISNGKEYSSKASWKDGVEKGIEDQKIIDNDDFWEEINHLNIYNHDKIKKK